MENLIFLLAFAFLFGVPAAVIVLIVQVLRLRARVAALEARAAALAPLPMPERAGIPTADRPPPAPAAARPPPPAETAGEAVPPEAVAPPSRPGPWSLPPSAAPVAEAPQPAAAARWAGWLAANWFYAVSALSLGLAGVFLVQYGIEAGLLTPAMRVAAAAALGLALLVAGEVLRRRGGDSGPVATAHLPSTFSAAGIVVLYAAILAARALYGLVGPGPALAGLVAVGAVAVVFGWFYGPFLAAAGLLGAAAAPWLVGGDPGAADFLSAYYALLGGVALAVDAMRRWGWVSALGLGLAFLGGRLAFEAGAGFAGHAAMLAALAVMAAHLPRLEARPRHPGPALLPALAARQPGATIPPVRIAWAAMALASALILGALPAAQGEEALLAALVFTLLGLFASLGTRQAPGLADLAAAPVAGFLALLVLEPLMGGSLWRSFADFVPAEAPEVAPPATVTMLTLMGAALAAALALRGGRVFALAGAAVLVSVPVALELFWQPVPVIGAGRWAFHAAALAALATLAAERMARADGEDRSRAALAALAALTLVALALFSILAETALTLALSALIVLAAWLDRRFDLPETAVALHLGTLTILWRLVIDPGLEAYVLRFPLAEVVLVHAAALTALATARMLLRPDRRGAAAMLESGFIGVAALLLSILIRRTFDAFTPDGTEIAHAETALYGLTWSAAALAQLWQAGEEAGLRRLARQAAAIAMALVAAASFTLALTLTNPFFDWTDRVVGPQPFDSLAVAYLLPGLVFALLALRGPQHPPFPRLRPVFASLAAVFGAVWLFLAIRRFWQGAVMADLGVSEPELYSYTVALLVVGGAVFARALASGQAGLRRVGVALIGAAVLKVFLVDAADLAGLLRVFSFLLLGLALAGLAWLNRWAVLRQPGTGPTTGQGL